jgi:hypothetical protein
MKEKPFRAQEPIRVAAQGEGCAAAQNDVRCEAESFNPDVVPTVAESSGQS